jgi:hypothetical protein
LFKFSKTTIAGEKEKEISHLDAKKNTKPLSLLKEIKKGKNLEKKTCVSLHR